ncbi:glycoside hydrolase, partial [Phialemonium atrogriseum]
PVSGGRRNSFGGWVATLVDSLDTIWIIGMRTEFHEAVAADDMAAQQNSTSLPGLWPLVVDAQAKVFNSGIIFTLGAMADSAYEYLPKMSALLGGQLPVYQTMYEEAMATATKYNLFRPMTLTNEDILVSGQVHTKKESGKTSVELEPQGRVSFAS